MLETSQSKTDFEKCQTKKLKIVCLVNVDKSENEKPKRKGLERRTG